MERNIFLNQDLRYSHLKAEALRICDLMELEIYLGSDITISTLPFSLKNDERHGHYQESSSQAPCQKRDISGVRSAQYAWLVNI